MSALNLTPHEQTLANYDFAKLDDKAQAAKAAIASATSPADIKAAICNIWSEVKPFIGLLEKIPFVGKFITVLADVLNTLCS